MRRLLILFSFAVIVVLYIGIAVVYAGINQDFKDKILMLKWIAYSPTNFDPTRNIYPDENSIKEDLALLYSYGFNGLVTYGSDQSLAYIPRIAKEVGFQGVIMGIWDITSREEFMNAVLANPYVDGYCVGNEGLNARYDLATLTNAIAELKKATNKPVTTTEQVFDYSHQDLLDLGDWIFPNIHPVLCEVKETKRAALWIQKHYELLKKHCPKDRIILFKEAGFPTSGMSCASEKNQKDFFIDLERRGVCFVYFEAFDQKWKTNLDVESHWGLFRSSRKAKKFAASILKK